MKHLYFIVIFMALVAGSLHAQVNRTGAPLVSYFDVSVTPGETQNWSITMDNRGVMFFGTQSKGILTYDGLGWGLIPMKIKQTIGVLETDYRGIVYVGGTFDFGFLQPDRRGDLQFVSLADRIEDTVIRSQVQTISSIAIDSNKIYFTDRRKLYIYDFPSDSLSLINMDQDFNLRNAERIIVKGNKTLIADNREGIFEYKNGKLEQMPGGDKIGRVAFMTLLPYDKDNIMLTTRENGVLLYNCTTGKLKTDFLSEFDNDRLKEGLISGAVILPASRIAIGVSSGDGIYIFDHNGLLLQQISARTTGIAESTITSMYCDYASNSQLWFCTKGYINRAYISLPVSEFGNSAGLRATPGDIQEFNGYVYVSTDMGLYRSYTDYTNRVQFGKLAGFENQTFELVTFETPKGKVLIAGSAEGIYQIDKEGAVESLFDSISATYIRQDRNDPTALVTGSKDGVIRRLKLEKGLLVQKNIIRCPDFKGFVSSIEQAPDGQFWVLTSNPSLLYRLEFTASDTSCFIYDGNKGVSSDTLNDIVVINERLYLCTGNGLCCYNPEKDLFEPDNNLVGPGFQNTELLKILKTPEGDLQIAGRDNNSRYFDALVTPTSKGYVIFRRQFDFLPNVATSNIDFIEGNVWIVKGRTIYVIDKSRLGYYYGSFNTIFTNITAGRDSVLMSGTFFTISSNGLRVPSAKQPAGDIPSLRSALNDISFRWTTTSYVDEEKTEYRYKLEGFDRDWSKWEGRNFKDFTNLPHGNYIFKVKAKTITGLESEESSFSFTIQKPWYSRPYALIFYFLLAVTLVLALIRLYVIKLKDAKLKIENLLNQRTAEVEHLKQERELSIYYGNRIQKALLPSEQMLSETAASHFIMLKPRDIVSGDFYWTARKGGRLFVVAADCTGHGIPGAFMSLLGMSFLEETINRLVFSKPNQILAEFRQQISIALKQGDETDDQKDDMNLALLIVDYDLGIVEFSGANNPCYKVRAMSSEEFEKWEKGEFESEEGSITNGKYLLETVFANKMPVGGTHKTGQEFSYYEWQLEKEISYYLFTDGYSDQFNGITGKKFKKKNFKKLILDIQDYPMPRQKEILEERLKSWMGSSPQTDDILVLGLKA